MSVKHMKLAAAAWLLAAGTAASVEAADIVPGVGPAEALTALPDRGALDVRGAVYVPAYSSVLIDRGQLRIDFSVTLCIHNASAEKPIVVKRIVYYDATGTLVQDYLSSPLAVRPLGTLEVQVPIRDTRGGTSAKFVVDWAGAGPIAEPVMEALILGAEGTRGYSFVDQGRPVRIVGGNR